MTCTVCIVWQVAGSYALSYCKGRVPYLGSGMKIYSSGDCAIMAIAGSVMESAPLNLQQGHTQTDRRRLATQGHTDRQPMPGEHAHMNVCMYVCTYYKYM